MKPERKQKEFLQALKKKYMEDPKPMPKAIHKFNPTLIPYAYAREYF
jgi:hypothetical protein